MGNLKDGIIISATAFIIALVVLFSPIHNSDFAGMAYAGFSDPISTYTFNTNTNLVSASDSAVYKYGYYSVNGGDWQPFELTGTLLGGNWLTGTATKTLPNLGVGEHYIVIYSCTYVNRQWDCHSNQWQIKVINNTVTTQTCSDKIQNQGETGIDCGGPCTACSSSKGSTYHISTTGTDSSTRDGSQTYPWKTLAYACSRVTTSGAIIHVTKGTYTETSQCRLNIGVSIEGEGSDNSIIMSAISDRPAIILESSSVTNGNQSISYLKLDGNGLTAHSPITVTRRSNVDIHHCTIVDFNKQGVSFYGESGMPTNFCMNNRFRDNILSNCASYDPIGSPGNLQINSQQGMRVYNNIITQTARGANADGFALKCVEGYNRDMKIYNNTITVDNDDENVWTFAMEFWNSLGGIEIYDNRIQGVIDLAGHFGRKYGYEYTYSVHDNVIGHDYLKSDGKHGIYIENAADLSDVIVYNNLFQNLKNPILLYTLSTSRFSNISIYYNVFYNIGMNSPGWWGYGFSEGGESGYTIDNLKFLNNVFIPANVSGMYPLAAIQIPTKGRVTNVYIRNNIMSNFDYATVCTSDVGTGSADYVYIDNNIFYNNDATLRWVKITPTHLTQNGNIISNPMFTSNSNFHLRTGSPAINAGINVGLTKDYDSNSIMGAPDIGAFETNIAVQPTCTDNIQNQGETGIDCGGPCTTCQTYLRTFYVSSSIGSTSGDGSINNPWMTLSQVNSKTFQPGDAILFKRGDTWYGTLTVSSSGSSGNPITYGAYGVGEKPIISGFTTITGWTNEGNGIYSKSIAVESSPNMLTIDGKNTPIGRYPDTGWLTIDSANSNTQITDASLPSSPSWTGGEIVIRKVAWIMDRNLITSHSGNSISYSSASGYNGQSGWGYFIQNHLRTLTSLGEWYYSGGKLYMYFGTVTPTAKVVKLSTINTVVRIARKDYITIKDLVIEGGDQSTIEISSSKNVIIENCVIQFSGDAGIKGDNSGVASTNLQIRNNNINDSQNFAILLESEFSGAHIYGNIINNVGMIPGMSGSGDGQNMAIKPYGDNYLIDYNKLTNLGYNGIDFGGNNVKVNRNYIDGYAYVKDDCGAIYTSSFNTLYTGREITNNIILNGNLVPSGSGDPWLQAGAKGIYLDQHNTDILVQYNTISHSFSGIAVQNGHEINILDNTVYDCIESLAIYHTNWWPDDQLRNLNIQRNKFVNKDEYYKTTDGNFDYTLSTLAINAESIDGETDLKQYGVSDYNYYVKPLTSTKKSIMRTTVKWYGVPKDSNDGYKSLAEWRVWSGNDANSKESPKTITNANDLRFEYNPTSSSKTVSLGGNYIDVKGTTYPGSVTIAPYSAIVLIKN